MKQSLSPKELAQVIGVSESSLKRWADDGKVRVTRTMGGHRRITLQEAVRFARESRLPIVRPELLGIHQTGKITVQSQNIDADQAGQMLEKLMIDGQGDEARGLIIDLYLKGKSVAWLCDGPIRQAMSKVGEIWGHDSKGIYIEHRAIDICTHALTQIRLLVAQPELQDALPGEQSARPHALGGAPPHDPYILGSLMAACVCAEAGYVDVNLGANVPMESFVDAAQQYRPKFVWLSCSDVQHVPTPKAIDQLAQQLSEYGSKLIVGGQGNPHGTGKSENIQICESMVELSAFAHGALSA